MSFRIKPANDSRNIDNHFTISLLIRRSIFTIAIILSLIALAFAFLPWVASTRLVRDRIAIELSSWSGFRVSITKPPEIEVWPSFRAILTDLTFHEWGEWKKPPLIEVKRLEIYLSALSALSGNASFVRATMIDPILKISDQSPKTNQIILGGRIVRAIENTRNLLQKNGDKKSSTEIPFGSIEIKNGSIILLDHKKKEELIQNVSGKIDWPSLHTSNNIYLEGFWNNQNIKMNIKTKEPLVLLAGGKSPISWHIESKLLKSSFHGVCALFQDPFLDGHLEIETSSLEKAILWSKIPLDLHPNFKIFALKGTLSAKKDNSNFNGTIKMDTDFGTSNISFTQSKQENVKGSFLFQTLDLQNLLSLFLSPIFQADPKEEAFNHTLNYDINIESSQARIESFALENLKGSIIKKNKTTLFHLQKTSSLNGTVQGILKADKKNKQVGIEMNFNAQNIDGALLGQALNLKKMIPSSKGNITGNFVSKGLSLEKIVSLAEGKITGYFKQGNLGNVNLTDFIQKSKEGGFFALSEIGSGSLLIDQAEFNILINQGIGFIKKAEIKSGMQTIMLSGFIPYTSSGKSLALSGFIYSRDNVSTLNPSGYETRFFVGGSWDSPFISSFP